jgi:hypothetical protein
MLPFHDHDLFPVRDRVPRSRSCPHHDHVRDHGPYHDLDLAPV